MCKGHRGRKHFCLDPYALLDQGSSAGVNASILGGSGVSSAVIKEAQGWAAGMGSVSC